MEKRLTRSELVFSMGFLFMLVVAVATFFYGVKIGAARTEAKYEPMKLLQSDVAGNAVAYQQQDLVSFYHTVYLPNREFQLQWFNVMDKLRSGQATDPVSSFKELAKLAKKQYSAASSSSVPTSSPLLNQSQLNVLKSLKLFEQAASRFASTADNKPSKELVVEIGLEAYYRKAVQHNLLAQQQYYASMLKWGATVEAAIPSEFNTPASESIKDWNSQPLLVKNKIIADQLVELQQLVNFYPHDLSTRVDELIASGEASRLKIKSVPALIELLLGTKAVRAGDFASGKTMLYDQELLPQLPFFFPENQ
ncbi:hypothetical protein EBB07_31830 [Paenibacillaceae bacterium]|nr:hypothetical protein EBB07_31830 [Paenibacillaceae bacterium]